jgi:hypothetical protein
MHTQKSTGERISVAEPKKHILRKLTFEYFDRLAKKLN